MSTPSGRIASKVTLAESLLSFFPVINSRLSARHLPGRIDMAVP